MIKLESVKANSQNNKAAVSFISLFSSHDTAAHCKSVVSPPPGTTLLIIIYLLKFIKLPLILFLNFLRVLVEHLLENSKCPVQV